MKLAGHVARMGQKGKFIKEFGTKVDRTSAVRTATRYGLDGPGIEPRWGRDFLHLFRPVVGPPSLFYNGCRVCLPG
jgi:hypothetical protein